MVFRLILASVLSGVVLMGWGFYFWAFSPFGDAMFNRTPNEIAVAEYLKETLKETGNYVIPYPDKEAMNFNNEALMKAFQERHKIGPIVQIIFQREGLDPTSPLAYIIGFAHFVLSSLIAGILLAIARPGNFMGRWIFVSLLGIFAAVTIDGATLIWFHHPLKMVLVQMGFDVAGWILAGFVLAALVWRRN